MDLCTLDFLQREFGQAISTAGDPSWQQWITGYSEAVESYCGREFLYTERNLRYDGEGTCRLHLKHGPIDTVAEVAFVDAFGVETLLTAADYVIDKDATDLVSGIWTTGVSNYRVRFVGGLAVVADLLPHNLQRCVATLVDWAATRKALGGAKYASLASNAIGQSMSLRIETTTGEWPSEVITVLDSNYRWAV